ncbi:DUF1634 domain-containing protein [Prescottella sp. R16]|uniref:DUF1634 domain-containing protein n=1 Tax=Prescottella sp. R16 TaxID=3064529 RepID=UPI00272E34EC|nr:DUF1634 domain-containing protein [Prescottella sp. R16]
MTSVHARLAVLLRRGTAVAVTVTALGMVAGVVESTRAAASVVTVCGLLMFALLPVAGLLVATHHFVRQRDRTYVALTTGVLLLVAANVVVGVVS